VEVWCDDARNVLPGYPTESFGLVLTDPPYGQQWQSNRRATPFDVLHGDTDADRPMVTEVLAESVRLVGQHRHLYVFGPTDVLAGLKVSEPCELIWDKALQSGGDLTAPFGPQHERTTFAVSAHRHAGKAAVRADVAKLDPLRFTAEQRIADLAGLTGSPPCPLYSAAGGKQGRRAISLLARAMADMAARLEVHHAMRLQGFPDGFPIQGNRTEQFTQVGNAVPPPLAYAVIQAARGEQ
jgi:C-5 cytosine-specific DNA methylase